MFAQGFLILFSQCSSISGWNDVFSGNPDLTYTSSERYSLSKQSSYITLCNFQGISNSAIYITSSHSKLLIEYCNFHKCTTQDREGGGIYITSTSSQAYLRKSTATECSSPEDCYGKFAMFKTSKVEFYLVSISKCGLQSSLPLNAGMVYLVNGNQNYSTVNSSHCFCARCTGIVSEFFSSLTIEFCNFEGNEASYYLLYFDASASETSTISYTNFIYNPQTDIESSLFFTGANLNFVHCSIIDESVPEGIELFNIVPPVKVTFSDDCYIQTKANYDGSSGLTLLPYTNKISFYNPVLFPSQSGQNSHLNTIEISFLYSSMKSTLLYPLWSNT